jgi:hypothetical protein
MLASVPPGAGQYRFVRVIPVLIFPGARGCAGLVLAAKVLVSHHYGPPSQARFPDLAASERAGAACAYHWSYGVRRPGFPLSAGRVLCPEARVILFGSRATGLARPDSDSNLLAPPRRPDPAQKASASSYFSYACVPYGSSMPGMKGTNSREKRPGRSQRNYDSADPVTFTNPRHLHKGLSGACSVILAAVPPCTAECRFVRVASVLISPRRRSRNALPVAV